MMNYFAVTKMLKHVRELLDKLVAQSSRLNWKVDKIQEDVDTLKSGFDSLEEDVTVLESASSELLAKSNQIGTCLEEHSEQTEYHLSKVQTSLNDTKTAAAAVESFGHPCGGSGWQQVVNLDFTDSNTDCPSGWTQTNYAGKPHTCGRTQQQNFSCDVTSFPVDREYSRVCGRITAYQYGIPLAFSGFNFNNLELGFAYISGVSLTHGGTFEDLADVPTHIWSFANGVSQFPGIIQLAKCPCDGGTDPPPFVANDYFCESALEDVVTNDNTDDNFESFLGILHGIDNPLWDGEGCAESSTCCSRIDHPYFVKQLDVPTSDPIDARICLFYNSIREDIAVELVEIYVQ